jgi:hypothetical protein
MNADEIRELLPWYAAGALSPAERRAVEAELRQSPALRNELEEYRRLKGAVAEADAEVPELRPELIERTWRSIDAYEQTKKRTRARAQDSEGWLVRARRQLFGGWEGLPLGGRLAIAAQFAVILVLGGVLIGIGSRDRTYTVASGQTTVTAAQGPRFMVVFQPEAPESAIRELLESAQLEIVAGPSAEQGYVLAATAKVDPAATVARLRSASNVVRFAAPIEE